MNHHLHHQIVEKKSIPPVQAQNMVLVPLRIANLFNKFLECGSVKEFVTFCILIVTIHDEFLALWLQGLPLFRRNSSPCSWSKNPKIWDIWFMAKPCLVGRHSFDLFVEGFVMYMWSKNNIISPYLGTYITFFNHACVHLLERSIFPLCHTILLWCLVLMYL